MKTLLLLLFIIISLTGYSQFNDNQVYSISVRSTGKYLNGKKEAGIQFNFTNTDDQSEWKIIDNGDGTFRLESLYTSNVLTMPSSTEGDAVTTSSWSSNNNQKWIFTTVDGFYILKNKKTGLVLTVDNDYPDKVDSDPDIAYYDLYTQTGIAVGREYKSALNMQFEIEPVRDSLAEVLAVPLTGWKPDADKTAILVLNTKPSSTPSFSVKDINSGSTVLSGQAVLAESDTTLTWGQFYYYIDLSSITTEGNYEVSSSGFTSYFDIRNDVYENINYAKGGYLSYRDFFEGFWTYNSYYKETHTLQNAILHEDENNNEYFDLLGTYYDLQPYGWFDAHSRDSKISRTAQALSNMMLAYFKTTNNSNKAELSKNIRYGLYNLLLNQNDDGSWPVGKVRESSDTYRWTVNVDVNTTARCVRTLAMAYQVYKDADSNFSDSLLNAALSGWSFVEPHWLDSAYVQYEVEYRGKTEDVLTAAIELAFATGETEYFDFADNMLNESNFSNGLFVKEGGESWPAQNGNKFAELSDAVVPYILRYTEIARTQDVKDRIKLVVNNFRDYWIGLQTTVYGVPDVMVSRTTAFGNLPGVVFYSFCMLSIADYLDDVEAYEQAYNAFNLIVGANSFATSFLVGVGDTNNVPSVKFFKRSYENGIGAFLPGFTKSLITGRLITDFSKYVYTEGVVPHSSTVFYILESFNSYTVPEQPSPGDLVINEVKSNPDGTNTANFVEIFNKSDHKVNLSYVTLEHFRDSVVKGSVTMSGVIDAGDYIVVARTADGFNDVYGFDPDFVISNMYLSNDANGFILRTSKDTLDYCSDVPDKFKNHISVNHIYIRKGYDNDGRDLLNDWHDAGTDINGTPGEFNNVFWDRTTNAEACDEFFWPVNGKVYSENGIYYDTISNMYNVDSVFTLNLTLLDRTVTVEDDHLTANYSGALAYQWIDCDENIAIDGETSRDFYPQKGGNYSVEITTDSCVVISECYSYGSTDINRDSNDRDLLVYPNPVANVIHISSDKLTGKDVRISIIDINGRILNSTECTRFNNTSLDFPYSKGIYFIKIESGSEITVSKIIKTE